MNLIDFTTLLQEHPAVGFLLALIFLTLMFGIKNGIVLLDSRSAERAKAACGCAGDKH